MNDLKIIKTFINSQTGSTQCHLNGVALAFVSVKVKLWVQQEDNINIKTLNLKAPPEITAPCVLFASVRETKYTLSNISKPVGNLCKTNLGTNLITASEWNQPCLEIVCNHSCHEQIPTANRL